MPLGRASKARWVRQVVHVADVRRQPGARARPRGRRCSSGRRRRRAPAGAGRQVRSATGRSRGSGGPAARPPSTTRTTESSHGTWIGRSCVSQASASRASRSSASSSSVTIGSPDRLPLVITSTRGPGGSPGRPEQQVVQRGVRQHHAEVGAAGGDLGGHAGSSGSARRASSTIGRRRPASSAALGRADHGPTRAASSEVAAITANGLSPRALRRRSSADRLRRAGVAGQVVAAEALDREDRAPRSRPRAAASASSPCDGPGARARTSAQPRAAGGAGDRLGVEAAVGRIGVLAGAVGAHREAGHGGGRPVVGQAGDDREARAAVGAGDERVPVAPVGRVGQLGRQSAQVAASGETRVRPGPAAEAADGERRAADGGHAGRRDGLDDRPAAGRRRRSAGRTRHGRGRPSTSATTPSGVLVTCPASPSSVARACT